MNIGIIVHSQSGCTASVARALDAAFTARGDSCSTKLLRTSGNVAPRSKSFEIKSAPPVDEYDTIILGAPVWAFCASPVIMKYISGLENVKGKKVLCFVTKGLPFNWTGGTRAIRQMEGGFELTGATLLPGAIITTTATHIKGKMQRFVDNILAACA